MRNSYIVSGAIVLAASSGLAGYVAGSRPAPYTTAAECVLHEMRGRPIALLKVAEYVCNERLAAQNGAFRENSPIIDGQKRLTPVIDPDTLKALNTR